jgi:beta-aspartyl-peptidase (threonine type)
MSDPVLAVHGGAGDAPIDDAGRADAERQLVAALSAGWAILQSGGPALDAVEVAVASLERGGRFNAGRGAVPDREGGVSLDAAIMDGATRAAGAVASVTAISDAIAAARRVMERSGHVLMAGPAADRFALEAGIPAAGPGTFLHGGIHTPGTVGAVARDGRGNLAAATSTGGVRGKRPGRVGDSALIGAGTWADRRCAVSATGMGELFIRSAFGHQVASALSLGGLTLAEAADRALADVVALGGQGGCIALDADGTVVMPFSTPVMYRGVIDASGPPRVGIGPAPLKELDR